jgi:Icc-related predicted phosphoesterase
MIIDCISDLHGYYPNLEGGDLLIVAGDLTGRDTDKQHLQFIEWLAYGQQFGNKYKKIIYIAGNHDGFLDPKNKRYGQIKVPESWNIEYLCDSGTEFVYYPPLEACNENDEIKTYERLKLKIWGSPWTLKFDGMNPHCMAFTCDTEEELAEKWAMIPDDIDILVTHGPPIYLRDCVENDMYGKSENVGSTSLGKKIKLLNHKLHVFGHVHEGYGCEELDRISDGHKFIIVNASHVNEYYKPVNKPIRVIL